MKAIQKRFPRFNHWGLSAKMALLAAGLGLLAWPLVGVKALAPGEAGLQPPAGVSPAAVQVNVVEDTAQRMVLHYELGDFTETAVRIEGQAYTQIALGTESVMKQTVGAPELPHVCRSIIIPDDATMEAHLLASEYYEIGDIDLAPSKGIILRTVNPAEVPYTFGEAYGVDEYYPGTLVSLGDPYILRDHRGAVVELFPFQYNPVARILRVYTSVTVEVVATGPGQVNVLQRPDRDLSLAFHQIYSHHFLNYDRYLRYTPLDESGDMLIIYHDPWQSNVQPLVNHKNAIGITTTAVGVSTVGNTATAIKSYIQDAYDTGNLAFVLLVGDSAEVATPFASGGSADPTYALVAGGDSYPDILVGRLSAQTSAQLDTQVLRTVEYEQLPATSQDWFKRGVGIGSDQGAGIGDDGESDKQHIENIRADLLAYGYTLVDQIYDPGASASQVSTAVNAGRGIIDYCGHGSTTAWSTTGFSSSHVNALVNDNMLPFIFSVACVNGQFDGYTCFAEAWLRATNGSEPTGAVGIYASSINQSWAPPMCAQDECVDMLVAEAYFSFGALCFAGSCQMMDEYGSGGVSMFNTWHVFGDPSLRVSGQPEETCDDGILNQDEERIDCGGTVCPPCDCLSDGECANGLFCDGAETCDAYGHCQPGTPVDCNDNVSCTDDSCNEITDTCDNLPDDANCDNGLFCDGAETCDPDLDCQAGVDPCPGQDCDEVNDVCVPITCDNDGTCEEGEDCDNCPNDCISGGGGGICGNGVCEPSIGEGCLSCPEDCAGRQVGASKKQFCCGDGEGTNPVGCDDSRCTSEGYDCGDAPEPYCCGDGVCEGAEDVCNCYDCGYPPISEVPGVSCDDGMDNDCDGGADCDDPTGDCDSDPHCQSVCNNDGVCDPGEDCNSCSSDCEGRSTGKPSGRFCCGNGVLEDAEGDGSICDGNP